MVKLSIAMGVDMVFTSHDACLNVLMVVHVRVVPHHLFMFMPAYV